MSGDDTTTPSGGTPPDVADTSGAPAGAGPPQLDEATTSGPGGGRDRRRLTVIAVVVAVALVVSVIVIAALGGDDETNTADQSPSTALTTTTAAGSTTGPAPGATTPPPATTAPAPAPVAVPDNPSDYAVATFTAWQQGDLTALTNLAVPEVLSFLDAVSPDGGSWEGPQFEGAMGSTYATWTRPDIGFVVRVGNEMASTGEPHAVREVFFSPAPGRVAIFPFTTQDEADTTQAQVDQGHQPWLLDPAMVASAYSTAGLGWDDATVVMLRTGWYEVTDRATGAAADLALEQPVRTGEGGIWAVTRAGSVGTGSG